MTYRTANAQTLAGPIVLVVVNHLAQNGYGNIRAALPGHSQPTLMQGTKQEHVPDVTADDVIVEVETSDTIEDDHTASQWSLFADYAAKIGKTSWSWFRTVLWQPPSADSTRCASPAWSTASDARRRFTWAT